MVLAITGLEGNHMARDETTGSAPSEHEHPVKVDEGMRRWYESCPCCMSTAYPDIKRALDEERWASA